ncbi:hypothetical protein V6B14_05610 [Sporosarcina psychrophila]
MTVINSKLTIITHVLINQKQPVNNLIKQQALRVQYIWIAWIERPLYDYRDVFMCRNATSSHHYTFFR